MTPLYDLGFTPRHILEIGRAAAQRKDVLVLVAGRANETGDALAALLVPYGYMKAVADFPRLEMMNVALRHGESSSAIDVRTSKDAAEAGIEGGYGLVIQLN